MRWVIYKCGYVSENGRTIDDYITLVLDEKPQHVPDDCYAVQQIFDGICFIDVDDTKIVGEWFVNNDRTIKCKLNALQNHTNNKDLDPDVHRGFTVGNGKRLYFNYIWHNSGNATLFTNSGRRHVKGDAEITIHFI